MRWLALLLLTLSLCPALARAQPAPAAEAAARRGYAATTLEGDRAEFQFARFGEGIMIEDVWINGQGPYRFILDTGAEGAGRLDSSVVEALDIPAGGNLSTITPMGERAVTQHVLDSLRIGPLSFTGVEVLSRDYSREIRSPGFRPIHGILGYHLFNEYLLTINYQARTVTVERGSLPPADGDTILPIISDDGDPEVEVIVAGHAMPAMLDTGAMATFAVPDTVAGDLAFTGEGRVLGRAGDREVRARPLDGMLKIGALEFTNPDTITGGMMDIAIVGIRILNGVEVTFDQRSALVRIVLVEDRPRFGVGLGLREGATGPSGEIREVTPGSAADRAGVRLTDRVVSMNGRPVDEIDREDLLKLLDDAALTLVLDRDGKQVEVRLTLE